jgi:two-component system cell cycle sensor histidine kinase/response regulator CckA
MEPDPAVLFVGSPAPFSIELFAASARVHSIVVRPVDDGMHALNWIRRHSRTVVVLSTDLPDLDALEVLRRIKRDRRSHEIPVLVATGDPAIQQEALKAGADDILPLPWREEEWIARIKNHLELASLRASARSSALASGDKQPKVGSATSWISLAMQAGRMFGFEWDARTDEVLRTPSSLQVLAETEAAHDTGENWFRRVHPEDIERLRSILGILSPAYDTFDTKYRVKRSDGRWITLHESSRGFFDSANHLIRLAGVVIDVTEQSRAEFDLAAIQRNLLSLLEKVPIAVALTNEHGAIEYINEAFHRTFGYALEEITSPDDWWRLAYPDEMYRRQVIAEWHDAVRSGGDGGHDIPRTECLITSKDNAKHVVEVFGAVIGHRKLVLFNDITERRRAEAELRESEARFRLMADTAPILLWVSGVDKECTFFNERWLEFTGRTMEQELGNGWMESIHPDDVGRCLKTYTESFDARQRFQMEYRLRRADGQYGYVLDTGVPRFDNTGSFAGYIGSCLDVTDFKRQQESMLGMQKLESLGVIATGIAHDFNNLMSCILVDVGNTVSELEPESPAMNSLQRIEAVAGRASEIVRQIMAYAGQGRSESELVDLSDLVREMLRLLHVGMPRNVQLNLRLDDNLPHIKANAAQIRQVLMNLVLNAAEALGGREGNIQVATRVQIIKGKQTLQSRAGLAEGAYLVLTISDDGCGMTEEVQRRIFDPFFTTKIAGRGLGLHAVHQIIKSHAGSISVASTPGVGTTFEIRLPCGEQPKQATGISDRAPDISEPSGIAILIVEDEETLRVSVSHLLRKHGFTVLEAPDGDAAVEVISSRGSEIGVLLLDLMLPGQSSIKILECLQHFSPDAKVILTSAIGWEVLDGRLRALGHDTFIRKPYQVQKLIALIRNAITPLVGATSSNGHGQSAGA